MLMVKTFCRVGENCVAYIPHLPPPHALFLSVWRPSFKNERNAYVRVHVIALHTSALSKAQAAPAVERLANIRGTNSLACTVARALVPSGGQTPKKRPQAVAMVVATAHLDHP